MKTGIFFLLVLLCSVSAFGQSIQTEIDVINAALKSGSIMGEEAADRAKAMREIGNDYPVLPVDSLGEIGVSRVISFAGVTQVQAFKRVKEWASLTFGSLDAVMHYEDQESGKLIFKGWTTVWYSATFKNIWGNVKSFPEDKQLLFTLIVTVKNGKAKIEYKNLRYKYTIPAVTAGSTYIPKQEYEYPMSSAFPMALTPVATWRGNVDLLNRTMASLYATSPALEKYIRDVINDYEF